MRLHVNIAYPILIFAAVLFLPPRVTATETPGGETLYFPCSACHLASGHGSEALGAPAIAGLEEDYIARQLRYYQKGLRGASLDDLPGRRMSLIMATFAEEEIGNLAAYVAKLEPMIPLATVSGDVERGRILYEKCAACHGALAAGGVSTDSPALMWLNDWYVLQQLRYFRDGIRGTHAEDVSGAQMRPFVVEMANQDLHALSAYIATLAAAGETEVGGQ